MINYAVIISNNKLFIEFIGMLNNYSKYYYSKGNVHNFRLYILPNLQQNFNMHGSPSQTMSLKQGWMLL